MRDGAIGLLVKRVDEHGGIALKLGDRDQILCTYGDRELTLQGYLARVEAITERQAQAADSVQVAAMLHDRVLPDLFLAAEIEASGLSQDSLFVADLDSKREELALDVLRQKLAEELERFGELLDSSISVSETLSDYRDWLCKRALVGER